MSPFVAVDWSHEDANLAVYSGGKITRTMPRPEPGLVIATENIPIKYARPLLEAGVAIFRCNTDEVARVRDERGIEKSHDHDVKIIHELYSTHPERFRPFKVDPLFQQFGALYASFKGVQQLRVATSNRLYADDDAVALGILEGLRKQEESIVRALSDQLETMPIYTGFLREIRGIGPAVAAGLLAYVGDIRRFPSASHLNSYFGLGVKDGKAPRRQKGQKAGWHHRGRSLILGVIADQFVKQGTPVFREVYDAEKARQLALLPPSETGLSAQGLAEKRARRKAAKTFMKDFYQAYQSLGRGDATVKIDAIHREKRLEREAEQARKKAEKAARKKPAAEIIAMPEAAPKKRGRPRKSAA